MKTLDITLHEMKGLKDSLLEISEDIWSRIDHTNLLALKEGVDFIQNFHEQIKSLDMALQQLDSVKKSYESLVEKDLLKSPPNGPSGASTVGCKPKKKAKRTLPATPPDPSREFYGLDENFTHQKPVSISVLNRKEIYVKTWKGVFVAFFQEIDRVFPKKTDELVDHPALISRRGNPLLCRDPMDVRQGVKLKENVYVEANLSAKQMTQFMRLVSDLVGLPHDQVQIALKKGKTDDPPVILDDDLMI